MGSPRYVPIVFTADGAAAMNVVRQMTNAFEDLDEKADHTASGGLRNAFIQADLTSRAISAGAREVIEAAKEYLQYGRELANLDTLLDNSVNLNTFRDGLLDLDPELGKTSELARGMYQAISSGVDAPDALGFIADSAKAARAGLASTFETVDAGTSVMASYGIEGKNVMSIYDKMFETVKRGKVELPQLASSIGLVSNVAAQTGLSLDEMFAAIATSSRTNRPTVAIEGMRSALVNVIKPSEQATKLADELGIKFDAQSLKAKGLAGFLNEVSEATHGDAAKMAVLFGDVQALNFVMSITGNQAKTFADDLKGVSAASGTVEEAFQKQQQSIGAQADALKNSIEKGLIKTFLVLEPLLTGTLGAVNRYPAVFGAATVVVTGLAAAYSLYNTQLALNAVTYIPQAIKGIQSVLFWMVHFRTALTDTQTALTASAGWIGVAVAAIGLLVYAWKSYEGASDRANGVTSEQIKSQAEAFSQSQALAAQVRDVAAAQEGSTDRHEKLNAVLGRLDPVTQAYIKSLKDEKTQIGILTNEIDKNLSVRKATLEATLRTVGEGALQQKSAIEAEGQTIDRLNAKVNELQKNIANHDLLINPEAIEAKSRIDNFSGAIVAASGRVDDLTKNLELNRIKLQQTAYGLGLSHDQLVQFFQGLGYTKQQIDFLTSGYDLATEAAKRNADATSNTTDKIREQANEVFNLRMELGKLAGTSQETIDKAVFDIVKNAVDNKMSVADVKKAAQEKLKDSAIKDAVDRTRLIRESQKAAEEILSPSLKSGGGRKGSKQDQIEQLINLNAARFGVDPDLIRAVMGQESNGRLRAMSPKGAGGLMQLMPGTAARFNVNNRFDPAQNIRGGTEYLRFLLNMFRGDVRLALAGYNAGEGAVLKYGGVPPYRETQKYVPSVLDRYAEFKTHAKDSGLITLGGKQVFITPNMASEIVARFSPKGLSTTANQFAGQLPNVPTLDEAFRQQRAKDTDINGQQKLLVLRMRNIEQERTLDLQKASIEQTNQLLDVETQLSTLRTQTADDQFSEQRRLLIMKSEQLNLEKNLQDVQDHMAAFRAQNADDQFNEQRRLLMQQTHQLDLEKQIQQVQDEMATGPYNQSLRIQLDLLKDLSDIRQRDEQVIISQNRSQLELADKTVYHAAQANAKVLEFLAQQKGITDIVADAKIGVIQKSFDGIDSVLDRIIPKAHGFGDILKQIIGDLLKLEASKWLRRILGLEGGNIGAQGAQGNGNSGGGLWSNFRNLVGLGRDSSTTGGFAGGNPALEILSGDRNGGQGTGFGGGISNIIGGFRQHGFMGGLRNLIGLGGGGAAAASSAGGTLTATGPGGALMAGDLQAWLSGGGSAAAGGGGSMLGSLGALFTNPWTAVIAGAALGGFLLWRHFRSSTEKHLREAIQSTYGISVKDSSLLKQVKEIGEGQFGKGQVDKHLQETVALQPVKELLQQYAESTGQKSSLVTQKQLGDEAYAGNRFIKRIAGGIIPGWTRGFDHVPVLADGGEFMLRSDVTSREGVERVEALNQGRATIVPNVPQPRVSSISAQSSSGGGSSQNSSNNSSGMTPMMAAALIGALQANTESNEALLSKVKTMRPGDVLAAGASENPRPVADALHETLDSTYRSDELKRKIGGIT